MKEQKRQNGHFVSSKLFFGHFSSFLMSENQYDTGRRRGAVETRSAHSLPGTVTLI